MDGAGSRLRPLWVRVVLTADYLLTSTRNGCLCRRCSLPSCVRRRGRRYVVYSVLDAMLASAFDALEELELTLDALAATWTDEDGARRAPGDAAGDGRQPGDDAPPGDG